MHRECGENVNLRGYCCTDAADRTCRQACNVNQTEQPIKSLLSPPGPSHCRGMGGVKSTDPDKEKSLLDGIDEVYKALKYSTGRS